MGTTAEINDDIKTARVRLSRMRAGVEELDRRLTTLERRQRDAEPREKAAVGLEIRTATEQRLSALELLTEAEAQLAEREQRLGDATDRAKKQLTQVTDQCRGAAERFDRAMREAAAAVAEIEEAADPIRPFLPNGITSFTHMRHVSAAFRHAFAERLSAAERLSERRSMAERIGLMISTARQNSSDQGKRRVA